MGDDVDTVLTNAVEEALAPPPPAPILTVEPMVVELEKIAFRAATLQSIAQEMCRYPSGRCHHCEGLKFQCIAIALYGDHARQILARLLREGRLKYL